MSQEERSGKRDDRLLAARHRRWGFDAPFCDIDWWVVEYDTMRPVVVIDYKGPGATWPPAIDANARALGRFYHEDGTSIPMWFVGYSPGDWRFRIYPGNDAAWSSWSGPDEWMTERAFVIWMYALRGRTAPANMLAQCRA